MQPASTPSESTHPSGVTVGFSVGAIVVVTGDPVVGAIDDGTAVGVWDGDEEGDSLGASEGSAVGDFDGAHVKSSSSMFWQPTIPDHDAPW